MYSKEDILAKADWEGGLDEALDWFDSTEVPEPVREMWIVARSIKEFFQFVLEAIGSWLESEE